MTSNSTNHPGALFEAMADVSRAHIQSRRAMNTLVANAIESAAIQTGDVRATCSRCTSSFTLVKSMDDFGNVLITGGVRLRGEWFCDDCEYDELCDYVFDIEAERFDVSNFYDQQAVTADRDGMARRDSYQDEATEEPDRWPVDRPEPLDLGDLIYCLDESAEGGDAL